MKGMKIVVSILFLIVLVSCDDVLEVSDISDEKVQLLAPLDGASISGNKINLHWNSIEETDFYMVQLAQPNFENATQIILDSIIQKDTIATDLPTKMENIALLNGNYEWRIKAGNTGYETGYSSAKFRIDGDANIDIEAPNKAELLTPVNNANLNETSITFTWSRTNLAGSAEKDSIYIFKDAETNDLEIKDLGANKAYTGTLAASTYYWYIQSFDEAGNESEISTVFSFTNN